MYSFTILVVLVIRICVFLELAYICMPWLGHEPYICGGKRG